jgi:hypothetical protein
MMPFKGIESLGFYLCFKERGSDAESDYIRDI